jgi:maltose-binding protein MalE
MAEKLTIFEPDGSLRQMGFLPQEPGWFAFAFPLWFGGSLLDGDQISIGTNPRNLAAYRWVENYTRKYGADTIKRFSSGFGQMASAQSPFFSGKVAMVLNGVWLNNYIRKFSPGLEYGVAFWPSAVAGIDDFAVVEADVLAIPRGAKHPREAWEFIKYVNTINPKAQSREELRGMELLCFLQEKFSPMKEWSPYFQTHHPHPYIDRFRKAANSPHSVATPKIGIWPEYSRELSAVFDTVRMLYQTPEEAIAFCQKRVTESWERDRESLARRLTPEALAALEQSTSPTPVPTPSAAP